MYILIVSFTDRAVDRSHTRQTDIHFLGRIIGFHGAVDMGEHGGGRFAGGVIIAFFQVDIHTAAPRVLFHDADEFGAEFILCAVRIVAQGFIHSGIAHECPDHNAFAFEFIPHATTPPSMHEKSAHP